MKGRGGAKRRGPWLCFFRPVGDSRESDEAWQAGSKGKNTKVKVNKGVFKGEQAPPNLFRDSQHRLEAYLGRGEQNLHGASDSVLAQAAHSAAMERRLKGLSEDQIACTRNGAPCATWQVDSVAGSSTAPLDSGVASSFEGNSPTKAAHVNVNMPQEITCEEGGDSALSVKTTQREGEIVLPGSRCQVPGASIDPQLHAAPTTPSKLLNRVSVSYTPPDESEHSKTHLHDATPTNSDHSQDSIFQLAENSTSAPTAPSSNVIIAPSYTHQQNISTPLETIFPKHALHPSRSSHSLTSAAESLSFTDSSASIKLEVFAPAPGYHSTIRTIPITLSSCSGDHHTDVSTCSVSIDGDTASLSLPSTGQQSHPHQHQQQQQQQQPRQLQLHRGNHQRSKTMPHMHSTSHELKLHDDDRVSLKSVQSQHMRRHTAIVLLSHSDDEDEDDENDDAKESGAGEEAGTSVASVASSSSTKSRGNRTIRRLSEVFEGHHIPLQKLRRQMGNPEDPPGDLLSLMARRVFSQQGIMSRVNSEGLISVLDAHSSFNTPSNQERIEGANSNTNSNTDWLETRISSLPRIRTQISVAGSTAHSASFI